MAASGAPARWLIPAAASLVSAAVLTSVLALRAPQLGAAIVFTGGVASLLLLGAAIGRRPALIAVGALLLALAYVVGALHSDGADPYAPLVGFLLLLIAELTHLACEWRSPHAVVWRSEAVRWARIALVGGGGAVAATAVLAVSLNLPALGLPALLIGAASVSGLLALSIRLSRRVTGS